jgi:PncC family amidohydrolase
VLPLDSAHLAALVDAHVRPAAREGSGACARVLKAAGVSAAECEERLSAWLGKEGDVQVTCVPAEGEVWVRLFGRGPARGVAEAAVAEIEADVRRALGSDCYGADEDTLESAVGRLLLDRRLRVSVAESGTGGLLASRLSRGPGASRFFDRAVVAYSNPAKVDLLGVPETLLTAHGAVSEPVTRAMAIAIRGADPAVCGLAATGICGPDGGSPDKPVGTVYVGAASPAGIEVRRLRLTGGRDRIRGQCCVAALDLLRRALCP